MILIIWKHRCLFRHATQYGGQPHADSRDKGNQQQCNDHAQIERKRRLDHTLHGHLGNGRANEKHCAYRRCQKADTAVKDNHDTELDWIQANGGCDWKQDWRCNQDDSGRITTSTCVRSPKPVSTQSNSCSQKRTSRSCTCLLYTSFVLAYIFYAWRSIDRKKIDAAEMQDEKGHAY